MKRVLALIALCATSPAFAVPGGTLDTLPHGKYTCEKPGNALGAVGIHVPEADFTVINSSGYRTPQGTGIYLLTGDQLVFTSGPKKGVKFRRVSDGFLHLLAPDGSETTLRCVRGLANISS